MWVTDRHQQSYGQAVLPDSAGAYFLGWFSVGDGAGQATGPVLVGPYGLEAVGQQNIFLGRLDDHGALLWVKRYGDGGRLFAADMARAPDGTILVAGTIGGIIGAADGPSRWTAGGQTHVASDETGFVARLGPQGDVLWVQVIEDAGTADGVAVDDAGNVYVAGGTGSHSAAPPPLNRPGIAAVWAFTLDGAPLWSSPVASGDTAVATGVSVGGDGLCVSGYVHPRTDGEFTLGDDSRMAGDASGRAGVGFVARLRLGGGVGWTYAPPSDPDAVVHLSKTTADAEGHCYAVGAFTGVATFGSDTLRSEHVPERTGEAMRHKDALLVKLGPTGTLWAVQGRGGPASDFLTDIAFVDGGRVYAVGDFMGETRFGESVFGRLYEGGFNARSLSVVSVSADGRNVRAVANESTVYTNPEGIGVSADGSVYVVGQLGGDGSFGGVPVASRGSNVFVARLSRF